MKKCDKCGLELSLYKSLREVVFGVEEKKKVYVCRNRNCTDYKKEKNMKEG